MSKLPSWFDGTVGTDNETIKNPFSGESYELTPEEVAIYDFIMGCQMIIDRSGGPFNPKTASIQRDMSKGLTWFRKNNAEAYMVLLD